MNIHCIGNAHLDPAWMWRHQEGYAAFAATCRSALDRIRETEEFIFTVSSAACFEFVEKTDPSLFEQIKEAVKNGKWSLVGGWWCEPDCNLPSGESFLRQGLYGQSYFYSRFGITCDTGFCIDSFGHNANIPMLLQHCGMKNYIFMRPEEHEKSLDAALFNWQSESSDSVLAYRIPLHYSNYALDVKQKIKQLPSYPLYNPKQPWMIFYGVGNHGGGPTKEQIADIISLQKRGDVKLLFSSPSKFFEEVRNSSLVLQTIKGEMQPHAIGAYSAHSEVKALNRKAESALVRAEMLSVLSDHTSGMRSDWKALEEAWKPFLLNQFHDTLGGVAIKEAMNDVKQSYNEAISIASRVESVALARIASKIDTSQFVESLVVFNPNSFELTTSIEFELWHPSASEKGEHLSDVTLIAIDGRAIPTQKIEASGKINGDRVRFLAVVELPSFGWGTFGIVRNKKTEVVSSTLVTREILSNKLCELEYIPAAVYEDQSDTWGHNINGFTDFEGEFEVTKREVIESGPIRSRLRITSKYNNSELQEDFILMNDSDMIEHRVKLNWQEKHKVCKLRYVHHIANPEVRYEIPYGSISRSADGNEVPVGTWAFVQGEGKNGLGIIAPSKSSYSADDKYLSITIARSALYAHHAPPHQLDEKEQLDYLDQGEQEFTNYIVIGQLDWESAKMPHRAMTINNAPVINIEYSHKGSLTGQYSMLNSADTAIITAAKGNSNLLIDNSVTLRLKEHYGKQLNINIGTEFDFINSNIQLEPFGIKTLIVNGTEVVETTGLENLHFSP